MKLRDLFISICVLSVAVSCTKNTQSTAPNADSVSVQIPVFNADSAYHYIKTQVDFGSRVPNSPAHNACGDYLIAEMTRHGGKIYVQTADLRGHDGKTLKARNIIAAYNPEEQTRILLLAHWDSRPTSDEDPDPANRTKPVDGANDGASGVGVLMEIARQLNAQLPEVGVDIFFADMEDSGISGEGNENTWCLGSQHWAQTSYIAGYRARFGILLDMVGAPAATFPKEGYSVHYASHVVEKVWKEAQGLGFGHLFVNKQGGYITDDHVPINQTARIPTIDIIHFDENGFGHFWHTQQDNMTNIDKNTLKAVGQTVLNVIYKERK